MPSALRLVPVVALAAALACGGGAEEPEADAAGEIDTVATADTVTPSIGDTDGEFIPEIEGNFPDPIENDPCALVDAAIVTELTGVDATAGEAGDVYVESYGQRYTSCTFRPVETGVVSGGTFFGYELHHPVADVVEIRDEVLEQPESVTLENLDAAGMIEGRAWAEVGNTAIDLRCGACDRDQLARALETLVERYRDLGTER